MSDGYDTLLALAERERDLIAAGQWEDVVMLGAARAELTAQLPQRAPASARAVLEKTASIVDSNVAAIATASDGVRRELAHLDRGRSALASYSSAAPSRRIDAHG